MFTLRSWSEGLIWWTHSPARLITVLLLIHSLTSSILVLCPYAYLSKWTYIWYFEWHSLYCEMYFHIDTWHPVAWVLSLMWFHIPDWKGVNGKECSSKYQTMHGRFGRKIPSTIHSFTQIHAHPSTHTHVRVTCCCYPCIFLEYAGKSL